MKKMSLILIALLAAVSQAQSTGRQAEAGVQFLGCPSGRSFVTIHSNSG